MACDFLVVGIYHDQSGSHRFTISREAQHKFFRRRKRAARDFISEFSPVEFMKLMNLGNWHKSSEGELLAVENEPLQDVKLIYNGEVEVERQQKVVASLRDGTFIGEISFLQGSSATATVRTKRPTRYIVWPADELKKLLKRNPTMDTAMSTVFQLDLTKKLTTSPVPGE